MEDRYRTIAKRGQEVLYKDRKSKFFGTAFPIVDESEVPPLLQEIRDLHKNAGHVCYAWRIGASGEHYRANDDGEPANSAGMPIYGQIRSYDLTQVLVAVAREYGGTKLGVGGLIQAYKTTAQMALEECKIVVREIYIAVALEFGYPDLDKVMRAIHQLGARIKGQEMSTTCELKIALPKKEMKKLFDILQPFPGVRLQIEDKNP